MTNSADRDPEDRDSTYSESYRVKRKASKSSRIVPEAGKPKKQQTQEKIKVKLEQPVERIFLEEDEKHKSPEESTKDHSKPRYRSLTEKIKLNSIDLLGKINDIAECLSKLIDSINNF